MSWLKNRRKHLHLTQEDLSAQLSIEGQDYTPSMVSHWETGKYSLPLAKSEFRNVLSKILKMSEREVLECAGYEVAIPNHTPESEMAANLIDKMDVEKRRMALGILEAMVRS